VEGTASGHLHPNATEQWRDTVARVVTGTFNMQRDWAVQHALPWDAGRAQDLAQVRRGGPACLGPGVCAHGLGLAPTTPPLHR
jgi:hypothetical protein